MMRTSIILVAVTTAVLGGTLIASAQVSSGSPEAAQQNFAKKPTDRPVQAMLSDALPGAKVSLQQGFTASEREGQPISGKFEIDGGKLQLSVYTAKDGKFFEVVVDHMTGNIAKVEPITEGEDLTHAKAQKAAIDRARVKLADAATKAKGQAKGEAAEVVVVSVVPELKNDRPEVAVLLLQGKRFSTASQMLD